MSIIATISAAATVLIFIGFSIFMVTQTFKS
ncbi:hypothetical protein OYT1_ch0924 [Ferriphaselus amnicola]|uniref:Uncharacterized protein n=1 Tax=Ferriphaselus amnicola TaxID=1188319 RepID=A0A2Z6GAM1_9PROT|nr:hypothetical protein OYT1_ch0924 [Ferriphaselus amnicola]